MAYFPILMGHVLTLLNADGCSDVTPGTLVAQRPRSDPFRPHRICLNFRILALDGKIDKADGTKLKICKPDRAANLSRCWTR